MKTTAMSEEKTEGRADNDYSAALKELDRETLTLREIRAELVKGICVFRKRRKQLRIKCDFFGMADNKAKASILFLTLRIMRIKCVKKSTNTPTSGHEMEA